MIFWKKPLLAPWKKSFRLPCLVIRTFSGPIKHRSWIDSYGAFFQRSSPSIVAVLHGGQNLPGNRGWFTTWIFLGIAVDSRRFADEKQFQRQSFRMTGKRRAWPINTSHHQSKNYLEPVLFGIERPSFSEGFPLTIEHSSTCQLWSAHVTHWQPLGLQTPVKNVTLTCTVLCNNLKLQHFSIYPKKLLQILYLFEHFPSACLTCCLSKKQTSARVWAISGKRKQLKLAKVNSRPLLARR